MIPQAQNIDTLTSTRGSVTFANAVGQNHFIFDKVHDTMSHDSVSVISSIINKPASGHFLQQKELVINIISRHQNYTDWITIFFWGILLLVTLIWYFFPERVLRILSREGSRHKLKYSDNQFAKPGMLLYTLYILTFISTISAFTLIIITHWFPDLLNNYSFGKLIWAVPALIGLYYLLRFLIIYITGVIFQTPDIASKQIRENFRADLIQSFLLIPVLIVFLSTSFNSIIYIGIFFLILITAYKWALSLIIGLKTPKISLYHNILYLCALEIMPVIVLFKLIENYRIVF